MNFDELFRDYGRGVFTATEVAAKLFENIRPDQLDDVLGPAPQAVIDELERIVGWYPINPNVKVFDFSNRHSQFSNDELVAAKPPP